jgi:hypothetical protein
MATPRVVISTRSSPVLPLHQWQDVCLRAGIDGIDLDVAQSLRRRMVLRGSSGRAQSIPSIESVWIGEPIAPSFIPLLTSPSMVVVPISRLKANQNNQSIDPKAIESMRRDLPANTDLAIALSPVNQEGTRSHLDRLSAIRHVAEEWDVTVALDLTSVVDPKWEAEAAVLRLGECLRLVRFVPPSFDHSFLRQEALHMREIVVARVLAAIADFGIGPTLSIKVRAPFWDWGNPISIAEQSAFARNATLAKFQVKSGPLSIPPKRVG